MSEKYYTLGTHTAEQWLELHAELIADGNVYESVPSREVVVDDDKLHSPTRGSYLLTEEEVSDLRTDDRIKFINESTERYPDKFMPPEDELHCVTNNTLTDRWANSYNNYQSWTTSDRIIESNFSSAEPTVNRTTALYRMQTKQNPWKTSSTNENVAISAKVQQVGAGENVDIICADNASWIGHTEFINTGVTNGVNPSDYIGGNVLPGNGICDCLDLVLDAPYYIDPDWFNASASTRLMTRWDGTTVPVESVARSWWTSSTQRSSSFAVFGNIPVSSDYTRNGSNGSNTTFPTTGTHGTQCASLIFGRTHGWAYNANKWILNLYGSGNIGSMEIGFDIQKIFHQYKPNNSVYGTKDPTMSSNSWGYRSSAKSGSHYHFRNSGATAYGGRFDEPGFISWLGATGDAGRWKSEMYDNSMTQAGDELTAAGVIMITAAGNSNQQQVNPDHPNYDNRISNNNSNAFYQDAFTEFGFNVTGSTNRRGFPQHIGKTVSQTAQNNSTVKFPAINIGALDDDMTNSFDQDRKVNYSDMGSAIDLFAPGDGTLAATKDYYGTDTARSDGAYSGLTAIASCRDTRFSGTSAACPIAAGFLAIVMQYNRGWTYENLRSWIQTNVETQPTADMYEGTEVTTATANWAADYNALQGASRRIIYQATIPVSTAYPGGGSGGGGSGAVPEGTEIYLVTVGRHAFGSGASTQEPNTIRTGQEKIGSFADDPETEDIDETILADTYYANGGYVYPTHGAVYRNSNTLASNPIQLPPCYIYGGTSPTEIDQNNELQSYVLVEFWPEGYANRNTTDWTITDMTLTDSNTSSGNGYLLSPVAQSDHYLLSVYNQLWSTYPFQEQYDCIMQDNTRATFNSVAEAQAATNPSLLSLVELELPSTNQFAVTATLNITYEHTNSDVFTQSININQTVYNKPDKYVSRVQTIAPPGTMDPETSADFPDLPDETGPKVFAGKHDRFSIVSAKSTQPSGVVYGASIIEKTEFLNTQVSNAVFSDLTVAVGDISNPINDPQEFSDFDYPTINYKAVSVSRLPRVNGLYQLIYPDGSSILKLILDGIPLLVNNSLQSMVKDDLVGLTIGKHENGITVPYNYSVADSRFTSEYGVYDYRLVGFTGSTYFSADGVSLSWEWDLPKDFIAFGLGLQYINITTPDV